MTEIERVSMATFEAQAERSPGRPKGSKDSAPRKTRSDKGKKRGPYKKKGGSDEA